MENYPKPVTRESHRKIIDYLDNSIYKIKINEGKYGIGFFCYIKCHNKRFPVLITNYKIMNERFNSNCNNIEILINNKLIPVVFGNIYYKNESLDLVIIEIKENKKIQILDIDDNIYKEESDILLNKESIYIIYYSRNFYVSYGIIKYINKEELFIYCNINSDSNIYPIFNLSTNKLIGIYTRKYNYYSKGINFKYLINEIEFIYTKNDIMNKNNYKNEINILVNINKKDIGHKIYFLDNEYEDDDSTINTSHENLKELNGSNTKLYINKKEVKYKKYFIPDKSGIYNMKILFNIYLTDCSYMFAGCENIISINFTSFNTKKIESMKYMFYNCINLKYLNLPVYHEDQIIRIFISK